MPMTPTPQLKSSMFGRMPVGGQKPPGGAPAAKGPSGVRIEHRVGIATPPEVIWDLLYDLKGWSRWNPLYPEASGDIHIGQALRVINGEGNRGTLLPEAETRSAHAQLLELLRIVAARRRRRDVTVAVPGEKPQTIHPVVLEWVPNEQLHWKVTALGGLVKTVRYIEIEQLAERSCVVSNGEIFGGLLGPNVTRRLGGRIYKGLLQMSEALKAEAEARWKERAV